MNDYERHIDFIAEALDTLHVPYTKYHCWEGAQLRFPWCKGDVACHASTYGSDSGFVETYQFPWDEDDVSMLSPQEAIDKIANYYKSTQILPKGLTSVY